MIGGLGLDRRLLERGIAVVEYETNWNALRELAAAQAGDDAADRHDGAPEAREPNRVGSWLLAAPRPGIVGQAYFELIFGMADHSVPAVFALVASLPEIDPARIGIAGSSTHGFVALEAMRAEPRLAAAVVRVACGDYHRFLRSSSLALNDTPIWLPDGELVLDADYDALLEEHEPLRFADEYPPRPLLMINGGRDRAIPLACAETTAEAMERAYRDAGVPDRFSFRVFPDAPHDLGTKAEEVVLDWWIRWLSPSGS